MAEAEPVLNAASIPELLGEATTPPSSGSDFANVSVDSQRQPRITVYTFSPENGSLALKDAGPSSEISTDQIAVPREDRLPDTSPSSATILLRFALQRASIFARKSA